MIDNLGFHIHTDHHAELVQIRKEITSLTRQVTDNDFYSYEAGRNTRARLDRLRAQARTVAREAAMEDQRIQRLTDAVRTVGDADLGFIAYVVFGPDALPVGPLYEVRLINEDGYTVPTCIRTNLPAGRVQRVERELMTVDGPRYARQRALRFVGYRVQVTPF